MTEKEKQLLKRRKAGFDNFLEERMPVLKDFIERIGLPDSYIVLLDARQFIEPINLFLRNTKIEDEDRIWIITRIGYFIGELLVQQYNGYWFLDEDLNSPTFLRYVVGDFNLLSSPEPIDPFEIAKTYIDEPVGRDLQKHINEIIKSLER